METAPTSQTSYPLHEAVKSSNFEVLNTLLENGGNINVQNDDGDTLLHVAVNKKNHQSQELVALLLERGANPELRNRYEESPLILAIEHNPKCLPLLIRNSSVNGTVNIPDWRGNYPLHYALENETVVKLLLDNGVFIECKNEEGRTALHLASSERHVLSHDRPIQLSENQSNYETYHKNYGYYNVANQLLMHGAEVNSKDKYGNIPLHLARNIKLVRLLLDNGALVNSRNYGGKTPLHEAIRVSYDVANQLLMHGAEVNSKDNYERTPLHMTSDIKCVRLLLDNGALVNSRNNDGMTPLHEAIPVNYVVANELLMHGAEINSKDNYERTPLHLTTNIKGAELLLDNGALVNSRDIRGCTPLHMAVKYFYDVANKLLMHGADVNSKDNYGRTPLHMTRNIQIVRLLLDKGALVNSRSNSRKTPLHEAIDVHYDVANELLMHGAEVDSKDDDGNTPLYMARNIKCVRLLLDKGALVNSRNRFGRTPLHKAIVDVHYDVANELLMHGAEVDIKDDDGNTPLHIARDIKCVQLLLQKGAEVNSQDMFGRTILHNFQTNISPNSYINISYVANMLLDWGASLTLKDNEGRTPSDIYPVILDFAKKHNMRRACVQLSDSLHEELNVETYRTFCLEEAAKLKLARFGNNSMYDIFSQYSDPIFLSNIRLQKVLAIYSYMRGFPIYRFLLQSTYKLAEKRLCMLEDAADTLQTPLPREITWYILTFVDDDSLQNVVKAKEL